MIKALENKNLSDEEYIYTLKKLLKHIEDGNDIVGLCEEMGNKTIIDIVNCHPVNQQDLKARNTKFQPCPLDLRLIDKENSHKAFHGCFYNCGYKKYKEMDKNQLIDLLKWLIKNYKK